MSENETQRGPETVSRAALNYVVIGALFLFIGLLIGALLFGSSLTRADVEAVVAEALAGAELSGGLTRADVEAAIDSALADVSLSAGTAGSSTASSGSTDGVSREEIADIVASAMEDAANAELNALADNDPYLGAAPEDAVVTIVEFSDFNCGFCGRFAQETLPQIIDSYGEHVRFVYRDMPILAASSAPAAEAAHCADEQGLFWEFHDYLFEDMSRRDRATYVQFAEDNAMDVAAFEECIDSGRYRNEVTLDLFDGQDLGVSGTPAFFINGRQVSGAQPFSVFASVIDVELQRAGIEPPQG